MRCDPFSTSTVVLVTLLACTDDYGQFGFDGATTGASGGGGTTQTGPGGQGATGATGATGGNAVGGQTGATGGQGGAPAGGAGGSTAVGTVPCGDSDCAVGPDDVCCLPSNGTPTCEEPEDCGGNEAIVHCNGPEDCPSGDVCCGEFQGGGYEILECVSSCSDVVVCDPQAAEPCPEVFQACVSSQFLPTGYFVCQP